MDESRPIEDFVCVYVCHDTSEEMVIQSVLRDAQIPFMRKNWAVASLLGVGELGGSNILAPIEICVAPSDLEAATALLEPLTEAVEDPTDEFDDEDGEAREIDDLPEDAG